MDSASTPTVPSAVCALTATLWTAVVTVAWVSRTSNMHLGMVRVFRRFLWQHFIVLGHSAKIIHRWFSLSFVYIKISSIVLHNNSNSFNQQ